MRLDLFVSAGDTFYNGTSGWYPAPGQEGSMRHGVWSIARHLGLEEQPTAVVLVDGHQFERTVFASTAEDNVLRLHVDGDVRHAHGWLRDSGVPRATAHLRGAVGRPHDAKRCRAAVMRVDADGSDIAWEAMRQRLENYREQWGNADAPVGGEGADVELGRWCKKQRALRAGGTLETTRARALDALDFSWVAPSDMDDPVRQADWALMLRKLAAYQQAHNGSADVPKKYQPDPALGGWVAAVRRAKDELGDERVVELDAAGFAWEASRKCGSAFMARLQELQAFHGAHGHTDVESVLGTSAQELAQWRDKQRAALRSGALSPKRVAHLRELGLDDGESDHE